MKERGLVKLTLTTAEYERYYLLGTFEGMDLSALMLHGGVYTIYLSQSDYQVYEMQVKGRSQLKY